MHTSLMFVLTSYTSKKVVMVQFSVC